MESELIILPLKSSVLIGSQKAFALTLAEHNYSSFHTEVLKSNPLEGKPPVLIKKIQVAARY